MKLSDFVVNFLAAQGIRHVFAITGGASVHLIDSIAKASDIEYICPQHEQGGAMAADAYARMTGLGAAIATSGPGATNMLTGVCCSFYDSVPVLYITGQVSTFRSKKDTGVRQLGFQETDVVDIFKPVTKYVVRINNPGQIRYELEKAVFLARTARPGPVLVDIPDNVQREEVNPQQLKSFVIPEDKTNLLNLEEKTEQCIAFIKKAKRPVVIFGWGIYLAGAEKEALSFLEESEIPVAPTWAVRFLFPETLKQLIGSFGTHGTRYGNFAVQNADLIIAIGTRLDTHEAGSPHSTFAREAKKIIVDIDQNELMKYMELGLTTDIEIHANAKIFLTILNKKIKGLKLPDLSSWYDKINSWRASFPICNKKYYDDQNVNPYVFFNHLSEQAQKNAIIFADTGCSLAWLMQSFKFKNGQKLFSAFNNTPMGYALPASIGGTFADRKRQVICITGDGGLQMNIQELATIIRHNLPIKIFLFNNHGYSMIRQTQDQWLNSKYEASSVNKGLPDPDFIKIAEAYGLKTKQITTAEDIETGIQRTLDCDGPVFCDVEISASYKVIPQVKYGRPIEDGEPLLSRKIFLENMIIEPSAISRDESS